MSNLLTCKRPHVGVGVIIIKEGKVLLGRRVGAHNPNTWSPPGGKLELGEEIFDCAIRETFEEANIKIKNLRQGPYTNDYFEQEEIHYITIFITAEYDSGILKIMEPNKCLEWQWFEWDKLPEKLFLPVQNLLKQKFNPFNKKNKVF